MTVPDAADPRAHWERVYATRSTEEVSWYQEVPALSLALIEACGLARDAPILEVGGGAATLVDHLLQRGYSDVTVLDLARPALEAARRRIGAPGEGKVSWIAADVTRWQPPRRYALWHDRAVFHFLTETAARRAYVATLERALDAGGWVVIATFAPDGPEQCSGLPVLRHSVETIGRELGPGFERVEQRREDHRTPGGALQPFLYQRYRRR